MTGDGKPGGPTEPADGAMFEALHSAIAASIEHAVRDHEGGFVLKWVALIETAAVDGSRGVWTMTNKNAQPWDTMGLLAYARLREEQHVHHCDYHGEQDS